MVDQGKNIDKLNIKTSPVDANDRIVVIYSAANTTTAQTATIPISGIYSNVQANPANSAALVCKQGLLFFSNTHLYFADANNHLIRVALSAF
jgi:hypothetical protein